MRRPFTRFSLFGLMAILIFALGSANCSSGDEPPSQQLKAFCAYVLGQGPNPDIEWLGGSDGLLLRSTDSGQNYDRIDAEFSYAIHDLSFSLDGVYGYAIGPDGMYAQSNDGGDTWVTQMLGSNLNPNLNGLTWAPLDPMKGWIVGDGGFIYFTEDRGVTWDLQDSKTLANLYGICFFDDQKGWAVGDNGTITGTIDGGQNWDLQDSGVGVSLRYCFNDDIFGLTVGFGGTVLNTDGLGNWNKIDTGITNDLYTLAVKPDFSAFLAGGDGIIIKSTDFGNSWGTVLDEAQAEIGLFIKRLVWALSGGDVVAVGYTGLGDGFNFGNIPDLLPPGEVPSTDGLVYESPDDGDNWVQLQIKASF